MCKTGKVLDSRVNEGIICGCILLNFEKIKEYDCGYVLKAVR